MTIKERITLILKGMCMGFADVVPGVSGGTMALVLGIYTQLIFAIKSVDLRLVKPLIKAVKGLFKKDARADLVSLFKEMQLPWLLTLALGIGSAIAIGSRIIPTLMDRYPEVTFAFFFGLVLASVSAPLKMIGKFGMREAGIAVVFGVVSFVVVGASVTPPLDQREVVVEDVEDGGQTLKAIAELGPSALPPEGIYWSDKNEALRLAVDVELERGLNAKAKDNPYNDLVIPAGTRVVVPAPAPWFIFIAGFIAICAMVLPGISGSFILLVLGSYYFILNALKGFLKTLAHLSFPETQLIYVGLFSVGALLGLIFFSRFLHWLLERAQTATMAALVGVMLGCLRTIWPFKETVEGGARVNVGPSLEVFGNTVWFSLAAAIVGLAIVGGMTWLAREKAGLHEGEESAE